MIHSFFSRLGSIGYRAMSLRSFHLIAAALVCGLAAVLRFAQLGRWSFWGDEAFTVSGYEDGFNFSVWRRSLASDLIQWTIARLGTNEWNARLVPALVGILSVAVLYWVLKPTAGKWTAVLAALLLAISPWHLYWSQNARFYTLLLLFYTLALVAFYEGLERDNPLAFLVSLLFLALAARERLIALFFLPVAILYILSLYLFPFAKPPGLRWRNLAIFFAPILLGAALFLWPFITHFDQWMANFGPPNNPPAWILAGVVYYTGLPLVCLAALGGLHLALKRQRSALYYLLGATVPLVSMMAIALVHYSANRYAFVSLTSWIILGALVIRHLLDTFLRRERLLAAAILAVVVVPALADLGMYYLYQNGNREDWKTALAYIQERRSPGEALVMDEREVAQVYLGETPLDFQQVPYARLLEIGPPTWFIEDADARSQFAPELEWVRRYARLEAVFDVTIQGRLYPMRVYHFLPGP